MEDTEKIDMEEARRQLYQCLARIDNEGDIEKLLSDLCTYTEIEQLSQRLLCAKLLLKGCTYTEIINITEVSSATLSRVSRCLRHGSGGYSGVLAGMSEKNKEGESDGTR